VQLREAAFIPAAVLMRLIVAIVISIAVIVMLMMWIVAPVTSAVMVLTGARRGQSG
jgi:antibiotic biosynthesis monooxygenase (ABM) superfamily enzyme